MARPKVGDLIPIGAIGNAKKGDVLQGKTYSSDEGVDLEGTMPNNGAINRTITTQGGSYTIPQGYHSGSGSVKAQFANLIASNIRSGVNVGGVIGNLSPAPTLPNGMGSRISRRAQIDIRSGETYTISKPSSLCLLVFSVYDSPPLVIVTLGNRWFGAYYDTSDFPYPADGSGTIKPGVVLHSVSNTSITLRNRLESTTLKCYYSLYSI